MAQKRIDVRLSMPTAQLPYASQRFVSGSLISAVMHVLILYLVNI